MLLSRARCQMPSSSHPYCCANALYVNDVSMFELLYQRMSSLGREAGDELLWKMAGCVYNKGTHPIMLV